MDSESARLRIASEQRVGAQGGEGVGEAQRVGSNRSQDLAQMTSAFGEDLFGDGVGGEERAEAQELSSGGIALLNALERQVPDGSDSKRIVAARTPCQQFMAAL